jgi:hypothetical protein
MRVKQAQGAILETGLTALQFAGLDAAEGITGPVVNIQTGQDGGQGTWLLLTPTQVSESMRNLNASVVALDADVAANVKRQPFIDSWGAWKSAWDSFQKENDSFVKLMIHGTGVIWRQAEEYRKQLSGWRDAYQRETGNLAPSGPAPVAPGPGIPTQPQKPATNWWLWGLGLVALVGVGGYAFYRVSQPVRRKVGEARERIGMAVLTRGGSEMKTHGGGE